MHSSFRTLAGERCVFIWRFVKIAINVYLLETFQLPTRSSNEIANVLMLISFPRFERCYRISRSAAAAAELKNINEFIEIMLHDRYYAFFPMACNKGTCYCFHKWIRVYCKITLRLLITCLQNAPSLNQLASNYIYFKCRRLQWSRLPNSKITFFDDVFT